MHNERVSRRDLFKRSAGAIGIATTGSLLSACSTETPGAPGGGKSGLTYTSWGGAYQKAQTKAFLEPFQEANPDMEIAQDSPTDFGKLVAMTKSGSVTWDLVCGSQDFGYKSDEKHLEKIDCEQVPCSDLQPDVFATTGYRVPVDSYSTIMAYRTDKFSGKKPQAYVDFFNLKDFPGMRGLYSKPGETLEMALLADGVSPKDLYPLDVERALGKLDQIKEHIIWWETGAQSVQLLSTGQVTMGTSWNGRIYKLQQEGTPVETDWSQHLLAADTLMIPRGCPNVKAAMRLMAYMTSAEHNAQLTQYMPYGPVNESAFDQVNPEMKPHLPTSYMDTAVPFGSAFWDKHRVEITRRFQEWQAK